ncbi:hypothetical protein CL635_02815 [bacterium]|nr:hypothetical protein [bacterium]
METTIRTLRRSRGVSQIWMARQLGIHPKTYHNYEKGWSKPPKSILFHAAHLLHVSPQELINEIHG